LLVGCYLLLVGFLEGLPLFLGEVLLGFLRLFLVLVPQVLVATTKGIGSMVVRVGERSMGKRVGSLWWDVHREWSSLG
jgi:hypothetical protein